MDYYLSDKNCIKRLVNEYYKYGTLIIALDYDGTISDFHNEGLEFKDIISLIKECNELNFRIVIYTANDDYNEIFTTCEKIGIKIEGINKQLLPVFDGRGKLYYNILLDDRAGLYSAYRILTSVTKEIKKGGHND